jgi:peptidoglycan/LPS O-acetylase OafA/YrhL
VPWHAYATFTQNIRYALGGPNLAYWLGATWSLAVEEQFYLLLPAVIWLVSERWLPYLLGGAILAAPAMRLLLNLGYSHGKLASFTLMPCREDALLLGVAAAILVRKRTMWESLKSNRRQFAWAWCVLLAGLPFFILLKASDPMKSIWMSTMGLSWMAFLYLGLLLLALIYSDSRLGSALRTSWLKSLGTISYGVYLLHWPVLGLTFMIFKSKRPWAETLGERGLVLLALTLTIVIASFSWAVFEKPLLRIGHRVKYGSGA